MYLDFLLFHTLLPHSTFSWSINFLTFFIFITLTLEFKSISDLEISQRSMPKNCETFQILFLYVSMLFLLWISILKYTKKDEKSKKKVEKCGKQKHENFWFYFHFQTLKISPQNFDIYSIVIKKNRTYKFYTT